MSSPKLSPQQLLKLNSVDTYNSEPRTMEVGGVELMFYPQSPERSLQIIMTVAHLLSNSAELKANIIQFFPQLEEVYEQLNYIRLMEIIGIVTLQLSGESDRPSEE